MLENKIKLNIITNRKLCENKNLERQIEKIFSAYEKKIILKNFEIITLTLREKDLDKNEYLNLVEKIYPICKKHKINLILHQNYDLNLNEKYKIKGIHLSYDNFKSLNKNIREELLNFIKELSSILTIPIFAIGGINEENSSLVLNSGAFGVCMMSSLMEY